MRTRSVRPEPIGGHPPEALSAAPPIQFSPSEMGRRHRAINDWLRREGLAGVVIYAAGRYQADIHWATDWPGGREAYLVWPTDGEGALYVQFYNHVPTARRWARVPIVEWAGPDPVETVARALGERHLASGRVGLVGGIPFDQYQRLQALVPDATLVDVKESYRRLRLVRSDEELLRFRYAAALLDQSFASLRQGLRPGLPLDQVPLLIEAPYLAGGGYAGIHYFAAMPMDGPFVAVPAQYWEPTPLRPGDVFISEITACYQGYQAQGHRTYSLGRSPDPAWVRLHEAAVTVFDALVAAVRPGVTAQDLMERGALVERLGFTILDDLIHGADQAPPVLRTPATAHQPYPADFTLEAGMVLVLQPNLVDGDGRGLQVGDTVVVTPTGAATWQAYPRSWTVVPLPGSPDVTA